MAKEKISLKVLLETHLNSYLPYSSSASISRKRRQLKKDFKIFLQIQKKIDLTNFKFTPKDVFL